MERTKRPRLSARKPRLSLNADVGRQNEDQEKNTVGGAKYRRSPRYSDGTAHGMRDNPNVHYALFAC